MPDVILIPTVSTVVLFLWWAGRRWLKGRGGQLSPSSAPRLINSRKFYVQNLLLGYLVTSLQLALILGLSASRGFASGTVGALVILTYSFVAVGVPVLVLAIILGYSVHHRIAANEHGFVRIWIGYMATALACISLYGLIVSIPGVKSVNLNSVSSVLLFLGIPAMWIATTTALIDWVRRRYKA